MPIFGDTVPPSGHNDSNWDRGETSSGREGEQPRQEEQPQNQLGLLETVIRNIQKTDRTRRQIVAGMRKTPQQASLSSQKRYEDYCRTQKEDQRRWREMKQATQANTQHLQRHDQTLEKIQVQIEPIQYIKPMQREIADIKRKIALIKKGTSAGSPTRAGPGVPKAAAAQSGKEIKRMRYTDDEDRRMVQFLIDTNQIDRARSIWVWEQMRDADPAFAHRTASGLKGHFKVYVLPKIIMPGSSYKMPPETRRRFRTIWS